LPVWLSMSAYTSTAEGHQRPTLVFTDFRTSAGQHFLEFFESECTRLQEKDWDLCGQETNQST
jgi:hypothetical protein